MASKQRLKRGWSANLVTQMSGISLLKGTKSGAMEFATVELVEIKKIVSFTGS